MTSLKSAVAAAVLGTAAIFTSSTAQAGQACSYPPHVAQVAELVGQGINAQRRAAGLRPLQQHESLRNAAFAHACDMAQMGRMTHTGSNGSNVMQRARAHGLTTCTIAENTAWGRPYEQPNDLVRGWMNSSGHRHNILMDRGVTYFGMGVAYNGNTPYFSWVVARAC